MSDNGSDPQHHTGARLKAAALKLRRKLSHHTPNKQQDQPESPLPTVPESRQLLDTACTDKNNLFWRAVAGLIAT